MELDRNINQDGCGKYAIINLRKLNELGAGRGVSPRWTPEVERALKTLEEVGALEWGAVGAPDEFFVLKLKDQYARPALEAYAAAVGSSDVEYGGAVLDLAQRSGKASPFCKSPD